MRGLRLSLLGVVFGGVASVAGANQITITGTGTNSATSPATALTAAATFCTVTYNGNLYLQVALTNQTSAVNDPQSILTAVFFDYNHGGAGTLFGVDTTTQGHDTFATYLNAPTGVTPTVSDGGTVMFNNSGHWQPFTTANIPSGYHDSSTSFTYAQGNVGGQWAFNSSSSTLSGVTQHYGIGASGLNDFGPSNRFDTTQNLTPPPSGSPGGVNWGLMGQAPAQGSTVPSNLTGTQQTPLIANTVTFRLLINNPTGFDINNIDDVRFQYGTSLSEANFTGHTVTPVPLPSVASSGVIVLAGVALAHAGLRRFRRPTAAA